MDAALSCQYAADVFETFKQARSLREGRGEGAPQWRVGPPLELGPPKIVASSYNLIIIVQQYTGVS